MTLLKENGYELRGTPGKGEGIFAINSFNVGETVMVGIIKQALDKNDSHASQVGVDKYIRHAGFVPKVNHSCDPNCGIHVNQTGAHDFVAMRNIKVNEEITFDYVMRNYSIDYFGMSCECGADNCRKKITGWKDLPENRKKAYEGFVAPYLLELDAKYASKNLN